VLFRSEGFALTACEIEEQRLEPGLLVGNDVEHGVAGPHQQIHLLHEARSGTILHGFLFGRTGARMNGRSPAMPDASSRQPGHVRPPERRPAFA